MTKIEDLIAQYCPNGTIFKSLKNYFKVTIGEFVHKNKQSIIGKYPVFNGGTGPTGLYDDFNNNGNQIIISARGANAGYVNKISTAFWAGNSCYTLTALNEEVINYVFIFYFLKANQHKFIDQQQKGGIPAVSKKQVEEFQIPIPPLPVQEEIVTILDKFTALEAELEAELEARTRQYEYYRNELLSFEGKDVEWKALGEVGEFIRGKRFVRTDMVEEGFPCIHYGEMYTHYNIYATESKSFIRVEHAEKLRKAKKGDVVIVAAGETIEDIGKATAWLGESDVVTHDACFTFRSSLNPKFVAYFSRTKLFHDQIKKHISSGKISAINAKGLEKAKIPVPPIEEQERIVAILDKFDALVNDISTGLPAEIQARRQQYEYYRGKLLTFGSLTA